jgi:hypothetical protein
LIRFSAKENSGLKKIRATDSNQHLRVNKLFCCIDFAKAS